MNTIRTIFALTTLLLASACGEVVYQGPATVAPMTTCYSSGVCVTTRPNARPSGVYVGPGYGYGRPAPRCTDAWGYAVPCAPRPQPVRPAHRPHTHGPACGHQHAHPGGPAGPQPRTTTRARPAPTRTGVHKAPQVKPAVQVPAKVRAVQTPHRAAGGRGPARSPHSTRARPAPRR